MDLLSESQKTKTQADLIIQGSGIINILSDYGQVKIVGSYALDTMLRPDLDFFVVREKHDWDKVLEVANALYNLKYFREVNFSNRVDVESPPLPTIKRGGYYFQTWKYVDSIAWKIDIWLITPADDKSEEYTNYFKNLLDQAPEKRLIILELKNALRQGKKYVEGVDGRLIYKAVLEKGITNIEQFEKFLSNES